MNLQETIALLEALKVSGAKYFKSSDFEVRLEQNGETEILTMKPSYKAPSEPKFDPGSNYNPQATKQVEDLIDLLKAKDEEILDKVMPVR